MTNLFMWDINLPQFTENFRVLRYDIRGQGFSESSVGPYSMSSLANDIKAMLDSLDIDKVHFVGLSLGGMIGQQFAIDNPDRLHSLVICNSACELPPRDLWDRCREIVLKNGMEGIASDTLRYWFKPNFLRLNKSFVNKFREMILKTNVEGYIACIAAIRDMNHANKLFKIRCPTLIVAGNRDVACTVNQSIILNGLIDNSNLKILKDVAHISNVEAPEVFSETITSFIKDCCSIRPGSKFR